MLDDFQQIDIFTPSIFDIAGNMLVAFFCGVIISMVYRFVYKGPSYSTTFVNSLVLLTMITSVVILVIGNNLARAFGLVGAMSSIRFRTAVRDTLDIIFIFFSLTIGMAAGVGLTIIAIIATLVISSVIILLVSTNFASPKKRRHLLQIAYTGTDAAEGKLSKVLKKHCRQLKLVNLKNVGFNDDIEAFYHVTLKNAKKNQEFVRTLNNLEFVTNVNIFFDEDDNNSPTTI
ncbi:MAG: DUF4956 domain-containing protein [Bacteroidota bacterium]